MLRISGSENREEQNYAIKTLNSININDSCVKLGLQMPNKEQLLSHISTELPRVQNKPLWLSKVDLEYADGQSKLSGKTNIKRNFAIAGANITGCYRFIKGFYGLSVIPTKFQEKID